MRFRVEPDAQRPFARVLVDEFDRSRRMFRDDARPVDDGAIICKHAIEIVRRGDLIVEQRIVRDRYLAVFRIEFVDRRAALNDVVAVQRIGCHVPAARHFG